MIPMSSDHYRKALARIRWHAEIGANSFDTVDYASAAENARDSLNSIVLILDQVDDTDHLARIFRVVGVEPRVRDKSAGG